MHCLMIVGGGEGSHVTSVPPSGSTRPPHALPPEAPISLHSQPLGHCEVSVQSVTCGAQCFVVDGVQPQSGAGASPVPLGAGGVVMVGAGAGSVPPPEDDPVGIGAGMPGDGSVPGVPPPMLPLHQQTSGSGTQLKPVPQSAASLHGKR
jgi:hypothetical protein